MGSKDCTCKILSYYDVILRESDLDILRGPHWLNDVIIHFYYEWLSRTKLNQHPHAILLVPGAPTYMMTTIGCEAGSIILDPLHFRSYELVFFAVNNNPDPSVVLGGSHWSLVVWCRSQSTLRHYDTFAPCNRKASVRLLHTIQGYLGQEDITLTQMNCESQENGYDCGIILLAATALLCERWLSSSGNENGENTITSWELPLDISSRRNGEEFRSSLLTLINRLRDGGD